MKKRSPEDLAKNRKRKHSRLMGEVHEARFSWGTEMLELEKRRKRESPKAKQEKEELIWKPGSQE